MLKLQIRRTLAWQTAALVVGASFVAPTMVQAKEVDCSTEGNCRVENGDTLVVKRGNTRRLVKPNILGNVRVEAGAKLSIDAPSLIVNEGQSFEINGELSLKNESILAASNGGEIVLGGDIDLSKSARVEIHSGSTLVVSQKFSGGSIKILDRGKLVLKNSKSKIGRQGNETHIDLDGELVLDEVNAAAVEGGPDLPDPRIPVPPTGSGSAIDILTVPNPALCNIVGSLTVGSGTFNVQINKVNATTYHYGQFAIYGDFVLNGGTLAVTEAAPGHSNSNVNFDIVWADDVKRTQAPTSDPVVFSNHPGATADYTYRSRVYLAPQSVVFRIKDPP